MAIENLKKGKNGLKPTNVISENWQCKLLEPKTLFTLTICGTVFILVIGGIIFLCCNGDKTKWDVVYKSLESGISHIFSAILGGGIATILQRISKNQE